MNSPFKYLASFRLFCYDVVIDSTPYTDLYYTKESKTERELQIGKVRVIISG